MAVPGAGLTLSVDGIATPKQALLVWQRLSQFLPRQRLLRESLMQQRQLRLGDILDDYCPRERRLTNHAVVAMVGDEVKQTRCTTCDAEHEFKHAKVPRQRRRNDPSAVLQAPAAAAAAVPKRVVQGARVESGEESVTERLIDINAAPQSEVAEPDVARLIIDMAQRGIGVSYGRFGNGVVRLGPRTRASCGAGRDVWATRGTWTNCSSRFGDGSSIFRARGRSRRRRDRHPRATPA